MLKVLAIVKSCDWLKAGGAGREREKKGRSGRKK
jgi:hypothetical protein